MVNPQSPMAGANTTPSETIVQVRVGHWTDPIAKTGCTVVLFDRPARTVVDVRGGAPGTRETDLLAPGRLVRQADAILVTGGSAFGLAAADGVMEYLRQHGRGVPTPAGPVPIVPAAVIFDLAEGQAIAPDRQAGRAACEAATALERVQRGLIGAGTGATSGKLFGGSWATRGGLGLSTIKTYCGDVIALVVANPAGVILEGPSPRQPADPRESLLMHEPRVGFRESTTVCVVLLGAAVDETTLIRCAVAAHDGIARVIWPSHTLIDGDVVFVSALETGEPSSQETITLAVATEMAIERAIHDAITA